MSALLLITGIIWLQSCRKPLREASVGYNPKLHVAPLPFTSPACNPLTTSIIVKKGNNTYPLSVYQVQNLGNELKISTSSNTANNSFQLIFAYLRPSTSANYQLLPPSQYNFNHYNEMYITGRIYLNEYGDIKGTTSELFPVEVLSNGKKKIVMCDLPMLFTAGSGNSAITVSMNVTIP